MHEDSAYDVLDSYCANLISEPHNKVLFSELLSAPQGEWVDVAGSIDRLALAKPKLEGLDGSLVAMWLPAPRAVVEYEFAIILCLPLEIWVRISYYSPHAVRTRISAGGRIRIFSTIREQLGGLDGLDGGGNARGIELVRDDSMYDWLDTYCADLMSESRYEALLIELLAAPQAEWVEVDELVDRLGLLKPDLEGVEGSLVAAWVPAPEAVVEYEFAILFCLPLEVWIKVAYYSPPGRRRKIGDLLDRLDD